MRRCRCCERRVGSEGGVQGKGSGDEISFYVRYTSLNNISLVETHILFISSGTNV